MTARKPVALAGLVLAFCIISPASAPAKAGGTDRPVQGTISGTARVNLVTGALAGDFSGVASHIGKYTAHSEGTSHFVGSGLVGGGSTTIVAANGDRLKGTFDVTAGDTAAGHEATLVLTFTGGTGRFADLTGTLTINLLSPSLTIEGLTAIRSDVGTVAGAVSY